MDTGNSQTLKMGGDGKTIMAPKGGPVCIPVVVSSPGVHWGAARGVPIQASPVHPYGYHLGHDASNRYPYAYIPSIPLRVFPYEYAPSLTLRAPSQARQY